MRGAHAALDQHGLAQQARLPQQREVLHVARADLDDIGPFRHQIEGLGVERLGHDAQAESLPDFGHDLQRLKTQALKSVRRSARLVGAAAEELRAGRGHMTGNGKSLFAALDRTGTGDDSEVAPADGGIASRKTDDRVFLFHIAAGQFVRF